MTAPPPAGAERPPTWPAWGSDVIVDFLAAQGIEYVALNPGASFRGLHDSLANAGPDAPQMLEVAHEKIAVGMAHGYAKALGRPMAVAIHDLVGLLHATLGLYYAYVDRVPILALGGAGPMDAAVRRPWIDWIHSANVQNTAVRDYTKWDDTPLSVEALPDSMERAYRVALTEPAGPVYVAVDTEVQEDPLGERVIPVAAPGEIPQLGIAASDVDRLSRELVGASRPVVVAGYVGRDPSAWTNLQTLAELLGAGVADTGNRPNFPNRHPLNVTGSDAVNRADVVLLLDIKDLGQHTGVLGKDDIGVPPRLAPGARLLDLGFGELGLKAWAADQGALYRPDLSVMADAAAALPVVLARCRELMADDTPDQGASREAWRREMTDVHATMWAGWQHKAAAGESVEPITYPWLAQSVWEAIRPYDWVLTSGTANGWATRLWDFDQPYRHPGRSLGTATQIGIALGVALAHRGTGRLVVDLQPDGDLLFDASALWTATRHRIPMLVVMVNNRCWHNDLVHQRHLAEVRRRPRANAERGTVIRDPEPDFAQLARSFGWWAEGPMTNPAAVTEAVARAALVVMGTGQPALVDVVTGEP